MPKIPSGLFKRYILNFQHLLILYFQTPKLSRELYQRENRMNKMGVRVLRSLSRTKAWTLGQRSSSPPSPLMRFLLGRQLWKGLDLRIWKDLRQHYKRAAHFSHPSPDLSKIASSSDLDLEKPQGIIKEDQAIRGKREWEGMDGPVLMLPDSSLLRPRQTLGKRGGGYYF